MYVSLKVPHKLPKVNTGPWRYFFHSSLRSIQDLKGCEASAKRQEKTAQGAHRVTVMVTFKFIPKAPKERLPGDDVLQQASKNW